MSSCCFTAASRFRTDSSANSKKTATWAITWTSVRLIARCVGFALAGCLVVALAGGLVGAPLRVASHAETAAGVARNRAAMASTSASALILRRACFTRAATVSALVGGRPLKLTPFPVAWPLVGRVGLAGLAGVAGLVAARRVPDDFAFVWSTDVAAAKVRSSRPAARSLASWSALTWRAMSSKGLGLAVVALAAASRPFLACCRPEAGWVLDLPAGFLGALVAVAVVAVCRGLAMLRTPMPAYGQACRTARAVGDHGQPTTRPCVAALHLQGPSRRIYDGQAAGWSLVQAVVASSSTSASDRTRSQPSALRSTLAGTMATPWACRPPPWTWAPWTHTRGWMRVPSRRPTASASQRTLSRVRSSG